MLLKAYIVEDHEEIRFLLKRLLLRNFPTIQVVGETESAETAFPVVCKYCPDLVLVDISLPGMDGIEFIRKLRPACEAALILVVTGHEVELYRHEALAAGADDVVSKSDTGMLVQKIQSYVSAKENDGRNTQDIVANHTG